jgi:hypothetical protein
MMTPLSWTAPKGGAPLVEKKRADELAIRVQPPWPNFSLTICLKQVDKWKN